MKNFTGKIVYLLSLFIFSNSYAQYTHSFKQLSQNDSTFFLSSNEHIELSIYNLLGQKVAILVNKNQTAGSYSVPWDASQMPSGIYIYTLEIKDSPGRTGSGLKQSKKLVLLK